MSSPSPQNPKVVAAAEHIYLFVKAICNSVEVEPRAILDKKTNEYIKSDVGLIALVCEQVEKYALREGLSSNQKREAAVLVLTKLWPNDESSQYTIGVLIDIAKGKTEVQTPKWLKVLWWIGRVFIGAVKLIKECL